MDEINVIVVTRKDRKNLCLRYTDPVTGQKVEKSAGTAKEREAVKRAGEWETELRNGIAAVHSNLRWDAFREAYQNHVDTTLADGSADKVATMFSVVKLRMNPDKITRITTQWITRFQKRMLDADRSPATVESHCRHLKAALNWAKGQGWIQTVPQFDRLKRAKSAKTMKGRPITGEEFDRLLEAVRSDLKQRQWKSMTALLKGLWLSGLRLGEALSLTWDQWADGIRVDTSEEFVVLRIPAEDEKGGKDRTYPITPDFTEFLLATPKADRVGFVFNPELHRGVCRRTDTVSGVISELGRSAGIKVDENSQKVIYASAHDLRRSFGNRWARHVMPMVLKELMRHSSVATTEKFYVDIKAQETARFLSEVTLEVTPTKKGLQQNAETL